MFEFEIVAEVLRSHFFAMRLARRSPVCQGDEPSITSWSSSSCKLHVTPAAGAASGSTTTNATGALTSIFSAVSAFAGGTGFAVGSFTSSGIALTAPVHWFANGVNRVFYDALGGSQARGFGDAAGGVVMNVANWIAPTPFSGACNAAAQPTAAVTPVPNLGEWSLALLSLAVTGLGARRLRGRG